MTEKMKVGFTGTREGCKEEQLHTLQNILAAFDFVELHHGDCIGADASAHLIAELLQYDIVIHPPDNLLYRAYCKGNHVKPPRPYLERNRSIVRSCKILIACPRTMEEVKRSGTWSTVRYARKMKKDIVIIFPDGSTWEEGE